MTVLSVGVAKGNSESITKAPNVIDFSSKKRPTKSQKKEAIKSIQEEVKKFYW